MKRSYDWKIAIFVLVIMGLSVFILYRQPIRRGIDLRGGGELLFSIDAEEEEFRRQPDLAENTVDIIRERIDPRGELGIVIQARDQFRILMQLPGFSRDETMSIIALATDMGRLEWRLVDEDRTRYELLRAGRNVPGYALYPYSDSLREEMEQRVARGEMAGPVPEGVVVRVDDGYDMTGELISRVYATVDDRAAPAIGFELKPEGARRFGALTGDNIGEQLAIILNDHVYSAPVIQARIFDRGIITGRFSAAERDALVRVLASGSLRAPLVLESEQFVGPTLGELTIRASIRAGIIAAACVLVFVAGYYLVLGAIADFALALNILILFAVMAASGATLTLPGIAGILLTVGMAVDANVLIFERLREELRLGRELDVAIRMGYDKAFTAIFDSNLTTFATAAILYYFGTGPVRGFAITLSIGIIVSFFTAVFVTRVILRILVRHGIVKKIHMLHLLGRSNVSFLKGARFAMVASLAAIALGVGLFYSRGRENFDIDFTGGSVANLELARELPVEEVRRRVAEAGYEDAWIQSLASEIRDLDVTAEVAGAEQAGLLDRSTRFALRVAMEHERELRDFEMSMAEAFADVAQRRVIDFTVRDVSEIRARHDAFFGGIRMVIGFTEPLPAEKISASIDGLDLGEYDLSFYEIDEETGVMRALDDDASEVPIASITTRDISADELRATLTGAFTVPNPFPEHVSQVGPQVAEEMIVNAILAILLAMGFIVLYIWFRFGRVQYGFAAVVALAHDVLFTIGAIAVGDALGGTAIGRALLLGDFKINLGVVAALLTIVGYSLNDTIVVFDRIRENMRLKTKSDWEIITGSINQTLGRTILTSVTTITVLVVMYVFGGPGIHAFAYVMLVGILVGTYSSIFIASPVLLFKDVLRGRPIKELGNAK